MSKVKRDENGMIMPVKSTYPALTSEKSKLSNVYGTGNKTDEEPKSAEQAEKENESSGKPIELDEIHEAMQTFRKYQNSKKTYDERFKQAFREYNLLYTEATAPQIKTDDNGRPRKVLVPHRKGAQALNVIMNKHADAMDNYPEIICLPRAKDDEQAAKTLNSVIPCIHKRNGFIRTYSDEQLDKFVGGCGCYAVLWDKTAENGLGDIAISRVDILNLFWEPHIENIQDSANVFFARYYDEEGIRKVYPELESVSTASLGLVEHETYDNSNKSNDKVILLDWYYKKNGELHLCKFVGEHILYSSENEGKPIYNHGKYPFVLEPMFRLRDTPVGFGFMDVVRAPQNQLDELKHDMLVNIKVNSQPRIYSNTAVGVNNDDMTDLDKTVIEVNGQLQGNIAPVESKELASGAWSLYDRLSNEIKETSATNDASNGASAAGVTSGSAIAALQEAGGKVSRDSNKLAQEAMTELAQLEIELMRQFYNLPRIFRITGENNQTTYEEFDNTDLRKQPLTYTDTDGQTVNYTDEDGNILERLPIFDIDVKAQKASPFATAAQNEMMMNLFQMGAFNPQAADATLVMLDGMTFEGKEKLIEKIKQNQTLSQAVQELSNKVQMLEAMNASRCAECYAERKRTERTADTATDRKQGGNVIEITLIDSGNLIYFESKGHGSHDVCVAVSALCSTFLQYVREMQDENNVTIVNETYENGHTESEFYIVSSDAEVRNGIKALWTGFELYAKNFPDEIDLNYDDGKPK